MSLSRDTADWNEQTFFKKPRGGVEAADNEGRNDTSAPVTGTLFDTLPSERGHLRQRFHLLACHRSHPHRPYRRQSQSKSMANITNTVEVAVEEESWNRHGGGRYQAVVVEVIECCTYSREHKSISFSHTKSLPCERDIHPSTSPCSHATLSSRCCTRRRGCDLCAAEARLW
jgi:hypothetical protein